MASVAKRPDGRYRARYRDAAGAEHSRHFKLKRDADRWLDEVAASKLTGTYVAPKAGRITFKAYAEDWREAQVWRPSTAETAKLALNRVYKIIGDRPLESLTRDDMLKLVKALSEQYAPRTVTLTYSFVATILKAAVASKRLAATPCVNIKLPRIEPKKVVPLTGEQVARIADNIPPYLRALVLVTAGLGLRQGEAFGLTGDRIDFEAKTVTIDRQLARSPGGVPEFIPPKTESSNRTVPLPDSVAEILKTHIETYPPNSYGLVFHGIRGGALARSSFKDTWHAAVTACGLPNVVFHELRHHYASLLIHHGESVKVVQARLGHKSAEETLNTYAHLWPDTDDNTRAAVDAVFCGLSADYRASIDPENPYGLRTTG